MKEKREMMIAIHKQEGSTEEVLLIKQSTSLYKEKKQIEKVMTEGLGEKGNVNGEGLLRHGEGLLRE